MTDHPPAQFKMRLDDDEPDEPPVHEEKNDHRVERLGKRLTILTILLPILLIAILAYGYIDFQKRVALFHDSGTNEVQTLEKEVESRFTLLSSKHEALENAVNDSSESEKKANNELKEQLSALDKQMTGLDKQLPVLEKRLADQLNKGLSDAKKSGDEIQSATQSLADAVEDIQKKLAVNTSKIAAFPDDVKKEITQINGSLSDIYDLLSEYNRSVEGIEKKLNGLTDRLSEMETTVAKNADEKIGMASLKKSLEEERAVNRKMQSLITSNLEAKIEALRKEMQQLIKATSLPRETLTKPPAVPPAKSSSQPSSSQPGRIIEQNIQ